MRIECRTWEPQPFTLAENATAPWPPYGDSSWGEITGETCRAEYEPIPSGVLLGETGDAIAELSDWALAHVIAIDEQIFEQRS